MKAKEIAKKLLEYPDFEVQYIHEVRTCYGLSDEGEEKWGTVVKNFNITNVNISEHSEMIVLEGYKRVDTYGHRI